MTKRLVQIISFLIVWIFHRHSHTWALAHPHGAFRQGVVPRYGHHRVLQMRGGSNEAVADDDTHVSTKSLLVAPLLSLGQQYSVALNKAPILTKSVTAGCIFALSDYLAQRLENKEKQQNWTRLLTSAAVGLFCFGPAAHAWYGMIFRVFPEAGLVSTLKKASLGQLFFGPSFTCIFFAASLLQTGQFTIANWLRKIRTDLPGTWVSGLCFWPLVDLVSYSLVPVNYIPLFVNICSLLWTIYLSTVANRAARTD